ncbi:DUF4335 domain-containing protein [Spirulina sp. 06S082]|uniref:DUF4335 domain-containing protein n=1 Tax=Spirulina sp. 06S082 TaxID=3110248 RepID=UPI002B21AC49|nr:DUF4335 domain-containing protein [Spirulina sp. 06S082]MEA5471581.1 DUF4335 domain-containing protein [Spirulina sp. 06S082]
MITRRYTPPTCTLEIVAKRSPLARFWGNALVNELRFELRFDDPRNIQQDSPIACGDREQLDLLCDLVTTYVQDFLLLSSTRKLPLLTVGTPTPENPPLAPEDNASLASSLPYLQPKGLLLHELTLGKLAGSNSEAIVPLSATQLFDLATALDEYSAEIDRLPQLARQSSTPIVPVWVKVAAGLLFTVGLATAIVQLSQQPQSQIASTSSPKDAIATSPVEPLPPLPEPLLPPNPAFPDDLSQRGSVAPPPSVTAPIAPEAPFVTPRPPRPLNRSNSSSSSSSSSSPPPPPEEENNDFPLVLPKATPTLPDLPAVTSERSQNNAPLESTPFPDNFPASPLEDSAEAEALDNLPTAPVEPPRSPNRPETTAAAPIPPVVARPVPPRSPGSAPSSNSRDRAPSPFESLEGGTPNPGQIASPQVSQVQGYFQQRWQPPENLKETLEYRLYLANDGSLKSFIPLGEAALSYLDRTPMPQLGKPFVSPSSNSQTLQMRLILGTDGSVQTQLESSDR